ncbi:MAG: response regulator [Isosphaeraceae bacterium]
MPDSNAGRGSPAADLPASLTLGFVALLVFFLVSGLISYVNLRKILYDVGQATRTHDTLAKVDEFLSTLKDAETGQRGFLITGEDRYLGTYHLSLARIDSRLDELATLVQDSPIASERVLQLREFVDVKLAELADTIGVRRAEGFEAARSLVLTDRGKEAMDAIRLRVREIEDLELRRRADSLAEMSTAFRVAVGSAALTTLLGVTLAGVNGYFARRSALSQRQREWLQTGAVGLSTALAGDQSPGQVGDNVLKFLAEYLDAHAGAFFVEAGSGFERAATYGVPSNGTVPTRIRDGDGLLWQAAKDLRTFVLSDPPADYLTIGSGLGRAAPGHLVVAPLSVDGEVMGILELGHLKKGADLTERLLASTSDFIARAVKAAKNRVALQGLLEETQRQAEELQAQGEELRVSNEELEEQGRILKESQSRLELQQVELEQSNFQLEEHANLLARQRDDLGRSQASLELKARELEQASRYKSDFLANMSHELRTPLNSSLILAKLLADNPQGNLTDEQVRFARAIQSSGNDLLNLINDILDLSKIEAGRMEVRAEPVRIVDFLQDLSRTFDQVASQKGLAFSTGIAPGCPERIETDRQRLEQILKNLLSNAIKFTERGGVVTEVRRADDGRVAFAVQDSGIGIAVDQQEAIFEAFHQADGTTSRKYGGTGLGLSISRELARLLGGSIGLESEPGRGSIFTLTIPEAYDPVLVRARDEAKMAAPAQAAEPPPSPTPPLPATTRPRFFEDDRDKLRGDAHAILVVEDDPEFARILYDMAREQHLQCLVASTAQEGLGMAIRHLPSAIVLDIGLPDESGLSVLDRLKQDARTRHIPVHVVSASDHAGMALSLGAVGYLLKPVKRDDLARAIGGLEKRWARRMRRILVVEDDPLQLESLRILLGSLAVETIGAGTAAECLERLSSETFDCMVLDLSLPDASGYTLLETLSREDAYSFPPAIVYTGRELSAEEEQRLRRHSRSIIIKGAKSPERLLDEVTLFLHQVVSELPPEHQKMLEVARSRDAALEGKRILVVEDDVRNVFALTSLLEPRGASVRIARNGKEAIEALEQAGDDPAKRIDLVLMDVMMPEMDGLAATRAIRSRPAWKKLPILMLTAKAMRDDQEQCLDAGANDYMAKPLDVEKLLSLVRVWMPR